MAQFIQLVSSVRLSAQVQRRRVICPRKTPSKKIIIQRRRGSWGAFLTGVPFAFSVWGSSGSIGHTLKANGTFNYVGSQSLEAVALKSRHSSYGFSPPLIRGSQTRILFVQIKVDNRNGHRVRYPKPHIIRFNSISVSADCGSKDRSPFASELVPQSQSIAHEITVTPELPKLLDISAIAERRTT